MKYFCVLFVLVALCCPGCQKSKRTIQTESVEVTVTENGTPRANVHVEFFPKEEGTGEAAGGYTDSSGKVRISSMNGDPGSGAVLGEYIVTLSCPEMRKLEKPKYKPELGETVDAEFVELFPKKYLDPKTTPFTASVVKGRNRFSFNVETTSGP